MRTLEFFTPGIPVPQGSKRHVGRGILVESAKGLSDWRTAVSVCAFEASRKVAWRKCNCGVCVAATFTFTRPKSHFRTGKNAARLRVGAPADHTKTPDLDKLLRAVFDALTSAGVWGDDAQVCCVMARKTYGETPGVAIRLRTKCPPDDAGVEKELPHG